jgi:hypothetical protein
MLDTGQLDHIDCYALAPLRHADDSDHLPTGGPSTIDYELRTRNGGNAQVQPTNTIETS